MPLGKEEIRNRFGYHPGVELTIEAHEKVRATMIAVGDFLDETLPDGRAKALALTALQETSMWSNFAVAEQAPLVPPYVSIDPQK